jgi:phospholipid/cholesterol/gamma-HCH transport system substrate-binding protein
VASVTLDASSYEAVVLIDIDQRYRFPKDTSAKILTAGLLGEQYIGLEPGGDTAYLDSGGRIALTQSAVVLENIIGQMLYSRAAEGERK